MTPDQQNMIKETAKLQLRVGQLEKAFKHIFSPQQEHDRFCVHCDLYLTDNVHERAPVQPEQEPK